MGGHNGFLNTFSPTLTGRAALPKVWQPWKERDCLVSPESFTQECFKEVRVECKTSMTCFLLEAYLGACKDYRHPDVS